MLEWLEQYLAEIILVAGILITFAVQMLLCFKLKRVWLRLIPVYTSVLYAIGCFILMAIAKDMMLLVYLIFFLHSLAVLAACGCAWILWAFVKLIRRLRQRKQTL